MERGVCPVPVSFCLCLLLMLNVVSAFCFIAFECSKALFVGSEEV